MIKKIIKNSVLCLMIMLSTYVISACCGPKMCDITVVFNDVDENLGLENYVETIEAGLRVEVVIDLPIGYVYDNFSAKVGDHELNWNVELSESVDDPEYDYTVAKTLTVTIDRVNADHEINIDMSGVRMKKLEVNIAQDILNETITKDKDQKEYSNLEIVTINPDYLTNLMYLRGDAILERIPVSVSGKAFVEYGKHSILCYTKDNEKADINQIFSSVNKYPFTTDMIDHNSKKYSRCVLSTKGNVPHYLYDEGGAITKSRLYYFGPVKEDIKLYKEIPDYNVDMGLSFDDKENQFVLLTNRQDYNSDLLSISVYVPTLNAYNDINPAMDRVDDRTIIKLDKYDQNGDINNSNVYSEYGFRYDMLSMYIGAAAATDFFLTEEEKGSLSNTLYICVESAFLIDKLNIRLLSYEKQEKEDFPIVDLSSDYIVSDKGKYIFKIDKTIIDEFVKTRTDSVRNADYIVGNAFLDISFSDELRDQISNSKDFTQILFPLYFNGNVVYSDNDYRIEVFIEDEYGNRNYGFIDRQSSRSDFAYFRTDQLYENIDGELYAKNDFYISIQGPKYNDYYGPIIDTIYLNKPYNVTLVGQNGLKVEDPSVFNGVEKYKINLDMELNGVNNSTYAGTQLRVDVKLNITVSNVSVFNVDFTDIVFKDTYTDAIYMTNSIDFDGFEDFRRIDSIAVSGGDVEIKFGYYTDIYYFVYSNDENLEFDIFVGQTDSQTDEYVGVYDPARQISATKELRDILGNVVKVRDNSGKWHIVYTKYQEYVVYKIDGVEHYAYNNNDYCTNCNNKLDSSGSCTNC